MSAAPTNSSPPLPVQVASSEHEGRSYYHNHNLEQSTWEPPVALAWVATKMHQEL